MTPTAWFRSRYERTILWGLVPAVWFGASARAAYDLWAASALFFWATLLALIFCAGRSLDAKPVKLPLAPACGAFLAAVALSGLDAFDQNAARLEAWVWAFSFLMALLFLNVAETERDAELFLTACAASLIVPAAQLLAKTAPGSELAETLVASSWWKQVAIVGALLGIFYGFIFFFIRVFEQRKSRNSLLAFLAFAASTPILLLCTKWTMRSQQETPLINHNVLIGFALNWFFILWKGIFERGAFLLLFIPCFFILTSERSWWAYVTLLIGFGFYYRAPLARTLAGRARALGALAGAAAALVAAVLVLKARQHIQLQGYRLLGISRAYWWAAAARMFLARPWTGVGAGGFGAAYPFFRSAAVDGTRHAHSFPLQLLAETGLAGVAAALWAAAGYLRLLSRSSPHPSERRVFPAAAACVLCFSALHINLEFFLNKLALLILLAAPLAGRDVPSRRVRPLWLATAGLSLLLLAPPWLSLYQSSRLYVEAERLENAGNPAKAEALCRDAIALDRTNADCYWMLSWLSLKRFKDTGAPEARAQSLEFLRQGIRRRRDVRFLRLAEDVGAVGSRAE